MNKYEQSRASEKEVKIKTKCNNSTPAHNYHMNRDAGDDQPDSPRQPSLLDHHVFSSIDLYPVRPWDEHCTSAPMVLRMNDPWRCISENPLPFNHHHPSTCLNGDCVQGVVILTSHDSDFLIKVTALTGQFSSYGIGRVKSHTYCFSLPSGTTLSPGVVTVDFDITLFPNMPTFPSHPDQSYPFPTR
jgi:hypothetical protein